MVVEQVRFLIDESSLQTPLDDVSAAFELAHARILACREHGVGKLSFLWEERVNGHTLADWLFNRELGLDPLVARALQVTLHMTVNWDEVLDTAGIPVNVSVDGVERSALSVAAAACFTHRGIAIGCVGIAEPLGIRSVSFNLGGSDEQVGVWFVGDGATALAFFRDLTEVEDLDEERFFENAARAFPKIRFFRARTRFAAFDEAYRTIRRKVSHHLAVLNDCAPDIFAQRTDPRDVHAEFGARGVEASGESGNTKANAQAMRQRKVVIDGEEVTLEWHTKLRPHLDRIYFSATAKPYVVVGVFHKHLD